ncbi:acetylserotonin O-methyltransferase [Amycolatopsis arida]|nr:acetylserotonin O-methyltransferase [Amycolatopsis arida]
MSYRTIQEVLRLGSAFWEAKTLLTAVQLDVFTSLAAQPATEAELVARLGLARQAGSHFVNGLCHMGLLERDGEVLRNSAVAETYLDSAKPSFRGGWFQMMNWQFNLWTRLEDLLRSGDRQTPEQSEFDFYSDVEAVERFMAWMDAANAALGPALARVLDWSRHRSFVDLGGARGNVSAELVKAHRHLRGHVFDLPAVRPAFDRHMERLGMADKVTFHAGDFFTDELPPADAYIFGHVLHDWDSERCGTLVRRAADALRPGGSLLVYDAMIDESRPETGRNWLLSLNMQLITPGGREYPASECVEWMERAGLTEISVLPLADMDSVVTGRKA